MDAMPTALQPQFDKVEGQVQALPIQTAEVLQPQFDKVIETLEARLAPRNPEDVADPNARLGHMIAERTRLDAQIRQERANQAEAKALAKAAAKAKAIAKRQ